MPFESSFFMRLQKAVAVTGPPIAALDPIRTSSSSNVMAPLRSRPCTVRATKANRRHPNPIDRVDDRLATTPAEAIKQRKMKALQIVANRCPFGMGSLWVLDLYIVQGNRTPLTTNTTVLHVKFVAYWINLNLWKGLISHLTFVRIIMTTMERQSVYSGDSLRQFGELEKLLSLIVASAYYKGSLS